MPIVLIGSPSLCLDVLVETAAQGHVQHLDTPADGQQRLPIVHSPAGQDKLGFISVRRNRATLFVAWFTITSGVHVLTAGQQQAIQ
jgi:hypothetical protein